MATWVRNGTGTAPSATDANLTGNVSLDNGTAPGDFDPTAVSQVRIQWRLTITGLVDDSWDDWGDARLYNGTQEAAVVTTAGTNLRTTNGSWDYDLTDTSIPTTITQAQWESMYVSEVSAGVWAAFGASMKADNSTASIPLANVVVTITYTPSGGALTPSLFSITPTFGTATIFQSDVKGPSFSPPISIPTASISTPPEFQVSGFRIDLTYTATAALELTPSLFSITPTFGTSTLVNNQFLTPGLYSPTVTLYGGRLDQSVEPGLFSPTVTLYGGQLNLELTPALHSVTTSFPSARVDMEISSVLFSPTVTIYAGQLNLELTAPVVNITPTFGTATIYQSDIKGALYSVTPTFPSASVDATYNIDGSLHAVTPSIFTASLDATYEITAGLHSVSPTFGTATVYQSDWKGATVSVSTTFPQANIAAAGAPQELTVPSTFGVSTTLFNATFEIELEANLLTVSPSFPQARLDLQITPGLLSVNPTYFLAELAGDGAPQVLTPDLFGPGVSIYSGVIDIPVVGPTVSISPVWPSGSLDFEVLAPTLNIISIITDPGWELESTVGTVTVPLAFYGADLIQDQFLLANLLTVIVTFPSGLAGFEGGPVSVADGTDFSGILQQMVVARGGPATLDFLGSLNYLAGTDDLDLLEVLNILGSVAGTDLLEAIWQIAADAGPRTDLNLITKRWAESGNF